MTRIYIVGAGGFGREVYAWLTMGSSLGRSHQVAGFLDDNPSAISPGWGPHGVVGGIRAYEPQHGDLLVLALGDPRAKLRVAEALLARGGRFVALVHDTAVIGNNVIVGRGCVICPHAVVTSDVTLGEFITINAHSTIGHDVTVGRGSTLSGHVDLPGGVRVGEGVFLGTHSTAVPGVVIGDYARVGVGSAVVRRVQPHCTVFGVPARVIAECPRVGMDQSITGAPTLPGPSAETSPIDSSGASLARVGAER